MRKFDDQNDTHKKVWRLKLNLFYNLVSKWDFDIKIF